MNPPTATPTPAPTPRTDATAIRGASTAFPRASYFVDSDFARTLERELAETERLRFGADADRRRLRCELAAAKAECERFRLFTLKQDGELTRLRALFPAILAALRTGGGCTTDVSVEFLECVPNEVASVVSRLRAEVERWKTVAAQMTAEREHNANEASRLRAEVERLTAKIGNQADRIRYLEGATNHATGTPLSQAIARAEKAEADNAKWQKLLLMSRDDREIDLISEVEEQARLLGKHEQLRLKNAELQRDKARLDWLAVSDTWFDYPATESFNPETFRDAIDVAMKDTPTP
jgi:hypothetical protein